jgi:hypothetical protein
MINFEYQKIIFFLLSIIFLFLTNNFFTYEETIIYGATDGATYFQIANKAPYLLDEEIPYHKAQRFIFPYIVGLISNYTKIELFYIFQIFSTLFLIGNFILFSKILNNIEVKKDEQFFLLSLLIFNPYISRYFLAAPTMINDLMFIFSGTVFLFSLLKKNNLFLIISVLIASASRVNAVFFILALILAKLIYKKKFNYTVISIFSCVIIFIFISFINNFHANISGLQTNSAYSTEVRFGIFYSNYTLKEFLIFIFIPVLNFLPLLFIPILFKFQMPRIITDRILAISTIIIILNASAAIAAGPVVTGKNIIRLINLSYPFILYFIYAFIKYKYTNLTKRFIFIIFIIIWSLHPTYSNVNVFSELSKIFSY